MKKSRFSIVTYLIISSIGLAFLIGPIFTHHDLNKQHIIGHIITAPMIIIIAGFQLWKSLKNENLPILDIVLVLFGIWLALLPFAIPAPGLHIHAHILSGIVLSLCVFANMLFKKRGYK